MGGRPGGQLEGWGLASSPPELLLVDSPTSSSPPANRLLAARCLSQARPHLSPRPSPPPPPLASSHLLLRPFFLSGKLYPVSGNLTAKMFHVLPISGNCLIREDANVLKIIGNIFRSYQCTNEPDSKSYQEIRPV